MAPLVAAPADERRNPARGRESEQCVPVALRPERVVEPEAGLEQRLQLLGEPAQAPVEQRELLGEPEQRLVERSDVGGNPKQQLGRPLAVPALVVVVALALAPRNSKSTTC